MGKLLSIALAAIALSLAVATLAPHRLTLPFGHLEWRIQFSSGEPTPHRDVAPVSRAEQLANAEALRSDATQRSLKVPQ